MKKGTMGKGDKGIKESPGKGGDGWKGETTFKNRKRCNTPEKRKTVANAFGIVRRTSRNRVRGGRSKMTDTGGREEKAEWKCRRA